MTVRVTTLKGVNAGAYYVDKLPNYYLDAEGEPPGVWHGRGAMALGVTASPSHAVGDADNLNGPLSTPANLNGNLDAIRNERRVDDAAFLAVMAGVDPATGRDLGRTYTEKSVRGFDVTASAPKSVSLLWALGNEHTRNEVVAAHETAVVAMIGWIEARAHTRYRIGGQVGVVDAEGIVAAAFRQHTSRALDPQLHSHVVIANRVLSDDGRWLALDARSLKIDQRTLSAIYHAGLRAELTSRLGVSWHEPVNAIAEIAGIDNVVLAEFSARSDDIARRVDIKTARFVDTMQRDPTLRERWRIEREAVLDTRPKKPSGVEATSLHAQWRAQAQALGVDVDRLVRDATWTIRRTGLTPDDVSQIIVDAMNSLTDKQSTWRPAEIVRELAAAVPARCDSGASVLLPWLDQLAQRVEAELMIDLSAPIPDGVRVRRDGRPVTESAIDRALTTTGIIHQEEQLLEWARARVEHGGHPNSAATTRSEHQLVGVQAHVAAAVAGAQSLVLVVGPAGTGKTTALQPGIAQLVADGRRVFGVAPSAVAAEVLRVETDVDADTLDKLLIEHSLQRPPQPRYRLPVGTTIIVDEAAMVATSKLAQLAELADTNQWRVVLVGDPLQFSAVGRSGMFELIVDTYPAIELDTVHRFTNTWERDASLRLRRGDVAVLDTYEAHSRIHTATRGDAARAFLDAWDTSRREGKQVAMIATSNDTVRRLNRAAQQRRISNRELDPNRYLDAGPCRIHVGDRIVTRLNDRTLQTDRRVPVHNRDEWTITELHRDGSLSARGRNGQVALPAEYVAEHVELAYAQTSHASQGRTVDHSLLLVDGPTDTRGVYVPMTRGRDRNDVYVTCEADQTPRDILEQALSQNWIDVPAIVRRNELNTHNAAVEALRTAPTPLPLSGPEILALLESEQEIVKRLRDHNRQLVELPNQLRHAEQAHEVAVRSRDNTARGIATEQAIIDRYNRPLHRYRHRADIDAARTSLESRTALIPGLEATLAHEKAKLDAISIALRDARGSGRRPGWEHRLAAVRSAINDDLQVRAKRAADRTPRVVIDALRERPEDPDRARLWDHVAARVDQHRAAFEPKHGLLGLDDPNWPAYNHSRRAVFAAATELDPTPRPDLRTLPDLNQERERNRQHERDLDHDVGIEM